MVSSLFKYSSSMLSGLRHAAWLFDTLEVVLTRLELADPAKPADVAAVVKLAQSNDLRQKLNDAVLAAGEPPPVVAWLLECQFVLMEIDRVG